MFPQVVLLCIIYFIQTSLNYLVRIKKAVILPFTSSDFPTQQPLKLFQYFASTTEINSRIQNLGHITIF